MFFICFWCLHVHLTWNRAHSYTEMESKMLTPFRTRFRSHVGNLAVHSSVRPSVVVVHALCHCGMHEAAASAYLKPACDKVFKFSWWLVAAINFAHIRSVFERCNEGQSFRIFPLTQFLKNCWRDRVLLTFWEVDVSNSKSKCILSILMSSVTTVPQWYLGAIRRISGCPWDL